MINLRNYYSKSGPFDNRTCFDHLNTRLVQYSYGYCITTSRQIKLSNHLVLVEVVGCVCVLPLALLSWEGFVDPFVEVVEVELVDCVVDVIVGGVPPIRLFNTPSSMC